MRLEHVPFYIAGAIAATNFARTAWVFPNISRWFYLGDLWMAVMWLGVAIFVSARITADQRSET